MGFLLTISGERRNSSLPYFSCWRRKVAESREVNEDAALLQGAGERTQACLGVDLQTS